MELNQGTLQLAKAFEYTTLTRKDAVNKFGSEGQKNHFKKNGRFKDKKKEEPFLRTLNQLFESVDLVKEGRRVNYKLGAARHEVAERESGNTTNGNWTAYTKHLDALILAHLEYNIQNDIKVEKTHADWMYEFGLLNDNSYKLYKSKHNSSMKKDVDELIENSTLNYQTGFVTTIREFFTDDLDSVKSTFFSALNRMEKQKIITTYKLPKAKLNEKIRNNTGIKVSTVDLDPENYQKYQNKVRELLDKHEINQQQTSDRFLKYCNDEKLRKNVLAYKKELKNYMNNEMYFDNFGKQTQINVDFVWENLAIIVKATKKKTMDYLHKYHAEILREYQQYKEEKYLALQAIGYKSERKNKRLEKADKKTDGRIRKAELKEEKQRAFGKFDFYSTTERRRKPEFMEAIEVLDEIFGDKFIINEEKIKKVS